MQELVGVSTSETTKAAANGGPSGGFNGVTDYEATVANFALPESKGVPMI